MTTAISRPMPRVLVNVPCFSKRGGVSLHYDGLRAYMVGASFNVVGGRRGIPGFICLAFDYLKYVLLLSLGRFEVVLLNPSLGRTAIRRDALFLTIAKMFGKRVVVFFHGWDASLEAEIDRDSRFFLKQFQSADAFVVLASQFAQKLRDWGLVAPVHLSTTKVDERLLASFSIRTKVYGKTILFLSRIEAAKGIFVALDAFSLVLDSHPDARLIVAGSGGALAEAKAYAQEKSLANVEFIGQVSGDALAKTFAVADVYLFPTLHGEGMPTTVLEAMAFGLPVITRRVGGLADFFEDQKMGGITDRQDAKWFAESVNSLLDDPLRMESIGLYNHEYAKRRFLASHVAKQLSKAVLWSAIGS